MEKTIKISERISMTITMNEVDCSWNYNNYFIWDNIEMATPFSFSWNKVEMTIIDNENGSSFNDTTYLPISYVGDIEDAEEALEYSLTFPKQIESEEDTKSLEKEFNYLKEITKEAYKKETFEDKKDIRYNMNLLRSKIQRYAEKYL